jgi:hypothetical protein
MTDTYPVHQGSSSLWPAAVAARDNTAVAIQYGLQAHIAVAQAFQSGTLWGLPTYDEQRYLAYAPIVHGARGLFFWMRHLDWTTQYHIDYVVAPIAREVRSLIPVFLSEVTSISVSSNKDFDSPGHGINDITYFLGTDDDSYYLIAVNNTKKWFLNAALMLSGSALDAILPAEDMGAAVLFENRSVPLLYNYTGDPETRIMVDVFPPHDVNVYKIGPPPEPVTNLSPPDQATSVQSSVDLRWTEAARATSYNVYLSTSHPPDFYGDTTELMYHAGPLEPHATYYWRVDALDDGGNAAGGQVWNFTTLLGDFDADGDVDQADFGHLQVCLTGAGEPQDDPACADAKLDGDQDVDGTDVDVFLGCMTGPGIIGD